MHRRARREPCRPGPAPNRLLRELARRRLRSSRQPPARLPADQQELRALLRLRGSLMLTLLRDLRKLRLATRLPAAERTGSLAIRHVDCGSCNGCEHELTLVSGPDHRHRPLRARHRRIPQTRRHPPRHRTRNDPNARSAPHRLQRHARATPCRSTRRLRPRHQHPRKPERNLGHVSRTCSPSTSASQAAHRPPKRSHQPSSPSSTRVQASPSNVREAAASMRSGLSECCRTHLEVQGEF